MSICEFCNINYFRDPLWIANNSDKRAHHSKSEDWAHSLYAACMICTLLASNAKLPWMGYSAYTHPVAINIDSDVNALESLERDIGMPLYEATLLKLSDAGSYLITFRPSNAKSVTTPQLNREIGIRLFDSQSFIICPVNQSTTTSPLTCVMPPQASLSKHSHGPTIQPRRNRLKPNTAIQLDAQILSWIEQCDTNHASCHASILNRLQNPPFSVRLIAIDKEDFTNIHLVERELIADFDLYTTLSYSWGREQDLHPPKLTSHTLGEYRHRISFDILPKTFKEAIELTAALSIFYIWIDALCIVQDDDGQDFQRQAPHMVTIYGGSYCNIAAANSRNCSQGLYRKIHVQQPAQVLPSWSATNAYHSVLRRDLWESELLGEPLYSRAWVLQERLLAPRVLHYGAGQLFWQCRTLTACSSLPSGFPRVLDHVPRTEREWMQMLSGNNHDLKNLQTLDKSKLYSAWRSIVREYTSAQLTKSSDKLPAIEGVSNVMSYALDDRYCVGLWMSDLVEQLAWKVIAHSERRYFPYRAPSWAWPSVNGIIELPERSTIARSYSAQILGLPSHSSPATKIDPVPRPASLQLRGHVFNLIFVYRGLENKWTWLHNTLTNIDNTEFAFLHVDDDIFDHMEDLDWSSDDAEANENTFYATPYFATVLLCAFSCEWERSHDSQCENRELYSGFGLAIKKDSVDSTWSRIGLVTFEGLTQSLWDHLQERRMTPNGAVGRHLETENFDLIDGHIITLL